MGDKSNIAHEKIKKLQVETTVSRKTIVKKYNRNSKRKSRRKRSRKTYFNMLRRERTQRSTQDLCNSIQEFNVLDMDMKPMCDINQLPEEVVEWQKQDQIAYWKSRAISLEIENKVLRQHLRNVYAQQIEYYEKTKDWQELPNTNNGLNNIVKCNDDKKNFNGEAPASSSGVDVLEKKTKSLVLPKEPTGKNRLEEMEKIYGDMAPKIMGMETAIQLNYERLVEEGSPAYWPNIPLKL